jgi:hypothetical protein
VKLPPRARSTAGWPVIRQRLSLMRTAMRVPVLRDDVSLGEGVHVCDGERLRRLKLAEMRVGHEATNPFVSVSGRKCWTEMFWDG